MTLLQDALANVRAKATSALPPVTERFASSIPLGVSGSSPWTIQQQLQAYDTVGWLFAVVNRIAFSTATVRWRLYRRQRDGDRVEIFDHPLLLLWRRPNLFYTGLEFRETAQQHIDLTGESYWLLRRVGRTIVDMWPIRPDRMAPIRHPTEFLLGYMYSVGLERIALPREDVLFLRMPSPLDGYRGAGPVKGITQDLESEKLAALWNRNFFANSAEPGGIIEFPEAISDADFERLRLRWAEQHQGVANAHRVAFIEGGTWKDRKITQRDMQFEQMRHVNRDIILGAYGMPKHMLGIAEDVNRANAEAALVLFAREVIRPRLERIKDVVNVDLAPQFGPDLELDYEDPVPENRELNTTEAVETYKIGIRQLNEARRLVGEDDIEGGNTFVSLPAPTPGADTFAEALAEGAKQVRAMSALFKAAPTTIAEARRNMEDAWGERLADEASMLTAFLADGKGPKLEPSDADGYDWDWASKYGEEVEAELAIAFELAYTTMPSEATLSWAQRQQPGDIPTLAQRLAEIWARHRAAMLLGLEGDINLVNGTRQRVRDILADAIGQGQSLNTVQQRLREDFVFSRSRAQSIARTESATALGQGAKGAALAEGRSEKRWITQGDTDVSSTCRENEAVGWISASDNFPSGKETIPEHPRCRCNVRYRHPPVAPAEAGVAEGRCPRCRKLLERNVAANTRRWCPRCKADVIINGEGGPGKKEDD